MNPRDQRAYRKCLDCNTKVLPPRRKCNKCRKKKYTTTVLRPSLRGSNKVGLTLTKPSKPRTRRAKRQNPHVLGSRPDIVMSRWGKDL